jgi:hydroxymethylglutaryl-CoA reductase
MSRTSRIPGFYKVGIAERRALVGMATEIDAKDIDHALEAGGIDATTADKFVENVLGTYAMPYGVVLNVLINNADYVVPAVVEEPSVIAAASNAAKMIRAGGGFTAEHDPPLMVAQIQLTNCSRPLTAERDLLEHKAEILHLANACLPGLVMRGGGARDIEVRHVSDSGESMLIVHLIVDCRDAMGANLLNTAAEGVGARVAQIASGKLGLRILSNLCDRRCVRIKCHVPESELAIEDMSAKEVANGIVNASRFAEMDPYRAATHNKGIMNGIDAVTIACGNDWRAVEAGAHAFAARTGRYRPLAIWRYGKDGGVDGLLELPLALGVVGGTLRVQPGARLSMRMLGVESAGELATIAASVGLASNFAALRAMASVGIQRGHMALHARSIALTAGAEGDAVDKVAALIVEARDITLDGAKRALALLREQEP